MTVQGLLDSGMFSIVNVGENPEREITSRYSEWGSSGAGGNRAGRVPWQKEMPEKERSNYTPEAILRGEDQWTFEFADSCLQEVGA